MVKIGHAKGDSVHHAHDLCQTLTLPFYGNVELVECFRVSGLKENVFMLCAPDTTN